MPGRVSARPTAESRITRKPSSQTISTHKSTASPNVVFPDEGPSSALRIQICNIFGDAQRSTAGHRKSVVSLRKIQEACIYEPSRPSQKTHEQYTEVDFIAEIARCIIRLMSIKKSENVGDRLVRFLGLFLSHASEKDAALHIGSDVDDTNPLPETATTRLTSHIFSLLLQFLASKEKTVRYRSTQLVAQIINSMDSIEDEYYHAIRLGLLRRMRDKEPSIRVQAILGLGRLAGNEGDANLENDDSYDEGSDLSERLLEVLQNDPSAEVRRSLLLNLPLTPSTLPYLLERARDLDPATRRALYSRLLPALGDFRHLSLSMREKLLRWGLRDRDDSVRKATARLFRERWIEDCVGPQLSQDGNAKANPSAPNIDALLELLERIDIVNSGNEEGVALEAMKEFWEGRSDYQKSTNFEDPFWDHLSPESVFMARSFNDYCRQQEGSKSESLSEERMPEVTKLGFLLQRHIDDLIERMQRNQVRRADEEEDVIEQEFIVEQMLHIAKTFDYSDEIGRRKMFTLLRETLAIAELPDDITGQAVEVLRDVCGDEPAGEREFCRVVLEAVAEIHDAIAIDEPLADNEEQSFHSARSELSDDTPTKHSGTAKHAESEDMGRDEAKAIQEIMINMKCLHIAQCMLQNVQGDLQKNVHLVTMLNNLVVPAVRSHEAPIRERGLRCLGLCCLLDKDLAEENLTLFLHCFNKGHDTLKISAIHILTDILTTHRSLLATQDDGANMQKSINKLYIKGIKAEHTPEVQSAAITASSKLMLTSVVYDEDLLKQIVICYFDPVTKGNAGVRQALSYFLPVFCYSRRVNMERMASIVAAVMHTLATLSDELEEGEAMVGLNVIGTMLVDWTDPRKLVTQDQAAVGWDEAGNQEANLADVESHLDIAKSLLKSAMNHGCSGEEKKAIMGMLGKLYISSTSDLDKLQYVAALVAEGIDEKIADDAVSRNALNKLYVALNKAVGNARKVKKVSDDTSAFEAEENAPTLEGEEVEESMPAGEPDMKAKVIDDNEIADTNDSLLDELLDDENSEVV